MKNFISFSDAKETEKSENTIYLFDFEPNIRDFQESIQYLLQSIIMTGRFRLLKNRPRICGWKLNMGGKNVYQWLNTNLYAQKKTTGTNWVCKVPAVKVQSLW